MPCSLTWLMLVPRFFLFPIFQMKSGQIDMNRQSELMANFEEMYYISATPAKDVKNDARDAAAGDGFT